MQTIIPVTCLVSANKEASQVGFQKTWCKYIDLFLITGISHIAYTNTVSLIPKWK